MISELEAGVSDIASDGPGDPRPSDLLEVTFQKKPNQKYKYLEAEPKILGVTEMALTVFFISSMLLEGDAVFRLVLILFSSLGIIAGGLAIAAEKLHLPTLKACLGMQVVVCVIFGILLALLSMKAEHLPDMPINSSCWQYFHNPEEPPVEDSGDAKCEGFVEGYIHLNLINQLLVAVQFALSATVAAYCCKVIQCCSPSYYMPVIVVKSPAAPE